MLKNPQFGAFDLVMAVVVLIGILRGKKRGISEELLDVIQWITIVVVAGLTYRALGSMLVTYARFPILLANIVSYVVIGALIAFLFKAVQRAIGEKLLQGDAFGRFEYYLGMMAGAVRFACIAIFVLAILNAKYSTAEERAAAAKRNKADLGDIPVPSWPSLQQSIFTKSMSGQFIKKTLNQFLIEPVPPGPARAGETIGQRRERLVNEASGGK